MKHKSPLMVVLGAVALMLCGGGDMAQAGERRAEASQDTAEHPKSGYYHRKRGTRVYGYVARRGGYYSYNSSDVINTYGLTRNQFGSTNSFRNPWTDRQTNSGPFDHGFFRDSGMGLHGGDSLYQH
jgi:hypothetical protein